MLPLTPVQVATEWANIGQRKHSEGPIKAFGKGLVGGLLLSMSGLTALLTGGGLTVLSATYPGASKIIFASIFPFGIIMILLMGVDLVTSNQGIMLAATIRQRVPWWSYAANCGIVTMGNFIGSLIMAGLLGKAAGFAADPTISAYIVGFCKHKSVDPSFIQILVRGIGCNFLVCVAVWQATSAREVVSKVFAIWPPIFLFVACGFDHVVANQFFIPFGMLLGGANSQGGVWFYLWHSFLPSWIGNAIGAALITVPMMYIFQEPKDLEHQSDLGSGRLDSETGSTDKNFVTI